MIKNMRTLFAVVLVSLFGVGLLLDHSSWARRFETLRLGMLAIGGVTLSFYFSVTLVAQSQWQVAPYLTTFLTLLFCGYSLRYVWNPAHRAGTTA